MRFLIDEHIPPAIAQAIRDNTSVDEILEVRDSDLRSSSDHELLEWAANNDYVLLTYDKKTLVPAALERVNSGQRMCGVVVIRRGSRTSEIVMDLNLLVECGVSSDVVDQVHFVPFT